MNHASKGPASVYEKLLLIYPARYRQRYSRPMVQTFEDLLENEPTQVGRTFVLLRALLDLPPSAVKEHLTNGKELVMSKKMKYAMGGIVTLLLLANGLSWWFGNLHARQSSGIEKVTAFQLADAMQQDSFFSQYGDAALLFNAKVSDIKQKDGAALVTFETNRPYGVSCQFANTLNLRPGDSISVVAPGDSAERQTHGVLLHGCVTN